MSKTTFVSGSPVAPEWFNAIQSLQFNKNAGEELFDGEYSRLGDDALSNEPNQIKSQFYALKDRFLVSHNAGLLVNYNGGSLILPNGTTFSIAPGAIAVTNDSTSYVFINKTGAVQVSSVYPTVGYALAQVVAASGTVTSVSDIRPISMVLPRAELIRVFGGQGSDGAYSTATHGTTLAGEYSFSEFNIPSETNIAIAGFAYIRCSGSVNLRGDITIAASVSGGGRFGGSARVQDYLAISGQGIGGGSGHNAPRSAVYNPGQSLVGSGGASGFGRVNAVGALRTSGGGAGGGALVIEAAGPITIHSLCRIFANGADGLVAEYISGSPEAVLPGGGAGSGGCVWLKSAQSIIGNSSSEINSRGGRGANGLILLAPDATAGAGGGGGGGWVILQSPNVNVSLTTISVAGGAQGTQVVTGAGTISIAGSNGGSFGGQGGGSNGAGSAGQIAIQNIIPA
jgi:hypothetical protein